MAAGERIGDHSVSHPHFTRLTDAQMRDQVLRAETKIISVTGADSWFRFPFGDRNAHTISVVNSVGFVPVGWTVDTLGWKGTSGGITVQTVVNRVRANLRPGEIVLMHSGSGGVKPGDHSTLNADALPAVIKDLPGARVLIRDHRRPARDRLPRDHVEWRGAQLRRSLVRVPGRETPRRGTPTGIAADPATGGYWVLKSNGGVSNFNAPWYGSLARKIPPGLRGSLMP